MSELLDSLRLAGRDDVRGELGTATGGRRRWPAERLFYLGLATAITAAVLLGFSRTFFLRPWFPEWARAHGAPEAIFYVHGVVDVPVPPLQFLVVPLAVIALFAVFVTLAIVNRRRPQSHKRYMMLASIALIEAAVSRWPFAVMAAPSPVPGFSTLELFVDLFLVPMIVWDLASRGRVHPVTLWGGLVLIVAQPLRMMLAETPGWLAFASWAVNLVSR
jgi:hypothetical protein